MKKIIILGFILSCVGALNAQAANGDVIGHIYSTDICAYINGVEVPSYNIGGRTAVVIEDVLTDINYNDELRRLTIGKFNPQYIIEGKSEKAGTTGQVLGDIYETDIKTYMYDTVIPAYNIGGKTAVVIEDLGADKVFSEIGGRYFWNENERKINLEMLYENEDKYDIFKDSINITITADENLTEGHAVFNEIYQCDYGQEHFNWPEWVEKPENQSTIQTIFPIYADTDGNSEIIGHYFRCPNAVYKFTAFTYYYPDKLAAAAENYTPLNVTANEIIEHYSVNHAAYPEQRFDTDEYTFVYLSQRTTRGANSRLLLIQNNGTYHDYWEDFESVSIGGTKQFDNVTIDRENEKCRFRYDTDYEIDLKTGELKAL